jgi:hypothetical protein
MTLHPTVVERAFQLAKAGKCATVPQITRTLRQEGYLDLRPKLRGSVGTQLRQVCAEVQANLAMQHTAREKAI